MLTDSLEASKLNCLICLSLRKAASRVWPSPVPRLGFLELIKPFSEPFLPFRSL